MTVTDALLGPLLREDPARPRITHYDDAAGTRVELSGATLANWAAKTANWLRDELDVQPGDPVAVLLPPHWQSVGVLLGAWWCGAVVTDDPGGAVAVLCSADRLAEVGGADGVDSPDEVAAVSLHPLGASVPGLPPGVRDHTSEVRVHGDHFTPVPVPGSAPATPTHTVTALVDAARGRAAELGLTAEDRVLCTGAWSAEGDPLLPVLAAGAALVQVTGDPDLSQLARRCAQERVTATVDTPVDGIRTLP
ncbi:MAG: TIGR03089 family protein [Actinomycetota bacterium]|nr:TIGR03089 family protein [Actinomycetota bacterium]